MKRVFITLILLINSFCLAEAIQVNIPPIKIYLWHSLSGKPGTALQKIVSDFNHSQNHYQIVAVYKGNYNETLTALIAAFRAHQQPAISQVFDVGTATMLASPGAIVPVYQLMQHYGYQFNSKLFLPAIAAYYSDKRGRLVSMPLNASSAVLYYNKNAFEKAGLNPNQPPKTWQALQRDGKKLLQAGYHCAYTTTWPSWIQLEQFSAWNNLPFATEANGYKSYSVKVLYDNPIVIKHIAQLEKWQKQGIFQYGGRADDAVPLFVSGQCVMLTESSGALKDLQSVTNFSLGVGALPYLSTIKNAPQNTLVGGGSLWVMNGKSNTVYRGVAAFFHYLLKTSIQEQWQSQTGYLPLTIAAYQASKQAGYYQQFPGAEVAIKELTNKPPTQFSRGIRLGYLPQIRMLNNTAMESVFSGMMSASQAMKNAATQANKLLVRFSSIVKVGPQ